MSDRIVIARVTSHYPDPLTAPEVAVRDTLAIAEAECVVLNNRTPDDTTYVATAKA